MTPTLAQPMVNAFQGASIEEVIAYVVKDEHTLGFLFKSLSGQPLVSVLRSSPIRGGHHNELDHITLSQPQLAKLRLATADDFEAYRVQVPAPVTSFGPSSILPIPGNPRPAAA